MKSVRDSMFLNMMSTFSHIYIDWYLLIAQVSDVLLVFTLPMWCFISLDTRWYFYWGKLVVVFLCVCVGGCLSKTNNTLIVHLIEEKLWLYYWGFVLVEKYWW